MFVISTLAVSILFLLYGILFGFVGLAGSNASDGAEFAGVSGALGLGFGCVGLFFIAFAALEGYIALKLETPKKWIWIVQIIFLCTRLFNLATLPLTVYFLVQLLKPEYKDYYVE